MFLACFWKCVQEESWDFNAEVFSGQDVAFLNCVI